MVNLSVGNSLGVDIQTAEIQDGQITSPKMAFGLKLVASGSVSAVAEIDLTSLAAKKEFLLVMSLTGSAADLSPRIQLNGDTGANYTIYYVGGTTIFNQTGTNYITLGNALGADNMCFFLLIGGKGNEHQVQNLYFTYTGAAYGADYRGQHNGSADVTRIRIYEGNGGGRTFSGTYALYEWSDLE